MKMEQNPVSMVCVICAIIIDQTKANPAVKIVLVTNIFYSLWYALYITSRNIKVINKSTHIFFQCFFKKIEMISSNDQVQTTSCRLKVCEPWIRGSYPVAYTYL